MMSGKGSSNDDDHDDDDRSVINKSTENFVAFVVVQHLTGEIFLSTAH